MENRGTYRRAGSTRQSRPQPTVKVQKQYPSGKYRFVALVYVLRALCPIGFAILFGIGSYQHNQTFQLFSLVFLGLFFLLTLVFWSLANQVVCRLCRTPFLKHLKCSKKKGPIPHVLGDRSMATALALLFKRKTIRCQYCAEKQRYFS